MTAMLAPLYATKVQGMLYEQPTKVCLFGFVMTYA